MYPPVKFSYFMEINVTVLKAFQSSSREGVPASSYREYRWKQDMQQARGQVETCISG